jgi:hypothetical protein
MYVKKNIPNLMLALTCEEEGDYICVLVSEIYCVKEKYLGGIP